MDKIQNPFSPGAGSQPPALIGRDELLEDAEVLLARSMKGRAEKSMLITGLRGVGKTVLLNRIGQIAEKRGYHVVSLEVEEDVVFLHDLIQKLKQELLKLSRVESIKTKARKTLAILKAFAKAFKFKYEDFEFGLDMDEYSGIADSGNIDIDLPDLLCSIGDLAKENGIGIAIIIDEIQFVGSRELSALIRAMHKIQQRNLPVVLIGAGLPVMYELAGEAKSYAERLFSFPQLGPLGEADAIEAIRIPILEEGAEISDDALGQIYSDTMGYPYFLQEWGYHAWNKADGNRIELVDVQNAGAVAVRKLDENFFRVRFNRLTPKEKRFLHVMAMMPERPCKSSDIASAMGVKPNSIGPVRSSLLKKGMIYSPSYGKLDFTVPLFDRYMLRSMGEDVPSSL